MTRLDTLPLRCPPHGLTKHTMQVKVVAPGLTPKRGKGGSLASRQALLHSLCHIENWAVDLSWDVIARFGGRADYELPREFFDDFVTVSKIIYVIGLKLG